MIQTLLAIWSVYLKERDSIEIRRSLRWWWVSGKTPDGIVQHYLIRNGTVQTRNVE